ncbi:hypothetical protein INR49_023660 [Caranx melampygus]|nr:hypothetical protein INR49_023660 [Caranx melampygus]
MEHRLYQGPAHFETAVASLRALPAVHYEDVVTKDTGFPFPYASLPSGESNTASFGWIRPHHELFTRARHGGETTHGSGISKQAGSEAARQAAARSLELQARSSVPARIIHSSLPSTDGKTERHRASRFRCINPRVSAWAPVSPRSDGRVVIITE